jgi:hypothetical protein
MRAAVSWYFVEKDFVDDADDIEGVNIHYAWTPLGSSPDWEHERATRYMPVIPWAAPATGAPGARRLRRKVLRLPMRILDADGRRLTDHYLLHHYFEIFRDGNRHYSEVYTAEVVTGAGTPAIPPDAVAHAAPLDAPARTAS